MTHKILGSMLCIFALSACTVHKVTQKQQLCAQAQRENTLNQSTPQMNASVLVGVKKTQLEEALKQDC